MSVNDIPVVGAIIVKENKILCAQRGNEKALPGMWEFPGGKIEPDETAQAALARELIEELKIEVTIAEEAYEVTEYVYPFGKVVLTTFICHLIGGKPELTEHQKIKWLDPKDLNQLIWAPADIPAVEKLMAERVRK